MTTSRRLARSRLGRWLRPRTPSLLVRANGPLPLRRRDSRSGADPPRGRDQGRRRRRGAHRLGCRGLAGVRRRPGRPGTSGAVRRRDPPLRRRLAYARPAGGAPPSPSGEPPTTSTSYTTSWDLTGLRTPERGRDARSRRTLHTVCKHGSAGRRVGTLLTKGSRADLALDRHHRHCCVSRAWLPSSAAFWLAARAAYPRFR
jgi:hypothetical protein